MNSIRKHQWTQGYLSETRAMLPPLDLTDELLVGDTLLD